MVKENRMFMNFDKDIGSDERPEVMLVKPEVILVKPVSYLHKANWQFYFLELSKSLRPRLV